jgi:molecular chaperone DnaK (HSP70)
VPYALGIDIGSTSTTAAVAHRHGRDGGGPRASLSVPSVLVQVSPDLAVVAEHPPEDGDPGVIRGFMRRVGDDVPLLVGAEPYRPQMLAATLAGWVADQVAAVEGEAPDQVVLCHPAAWGPYRRGLLHEALWQTGLDGVTLLPEPVAAAEEYAARQPAADGATLAVYSLGGTHCECSVVRRTANTAFEVLASAESGVPVGGADFDDAILGWVRDQVGHAATELDATDPPVRRALARLRERCAAAKERLSEVAETVIEVRLPGVHTDVLLTRARFEELIRPALAGTLDTLTHTVRAAGVAPADLEAAILVGGAARIPLAGMLVSAALPCPVVVAGDPAASAACGAAVAARLVGAAPPPGSAPVLAEDSVVPLDYPPPRPPVEITPLVPPRHGLGRAGARSTGTGVRATTVLVTVLLLVVLGL